MRKWKNRLAGCQDEFPMIGVLRAEDEIVYKTRYETYSSFQFAIPHLQKQVAPWDYGHSFLVLRPIFSCKLMP